MTSRGYYFCGNCNKHLVQQLGWVCSVCKHDKEFESKECSPLQYMPDSPFNGPSQEPKKDEPDLDIHMINTFSSCAKVIEALPKERQQRVAKALGILYGT